MKPQKPIFVTRPSLPDLHDFNTLLKEIWYSGWITNMGAFHNDLEEKLCDYLGVEHISLFSNGTLALITAIQALELKGEVITTPFSFVATSHALHWNNITPVFTDVEPQYFNLDPEKIEQAITADTSALLPVHVYGKPCNTEALQKIADRYGLKIIYDAAHAFGVKTNGIPILRFGDLSILSFHATKVFNTIEGGAIISHSKEMKTRIDYLKNFGFEDETTVVGPGINAKMNEVQAAFGILQLNQIDNLLLARKEIAARYSHQLKSVKGITVPGTPQNIEYNHAYYPIIVNSDYPLTRDQLFQKLREHNIIARRYFYPLITTFPPYKQSPSASCKNLPVANKVANRVLCLPIYPGLEEKVTDYIVNLIANE